MPIGIKNIAVGMMRRLICKDARKDTHEPTKVTSRESSDVPSIPMALGNKSEKHVPHPGCTLGRCKDARISHGFPRRRDGSGKARSFLPLPFAPRIF